MPSSGRGDAVNLRELSFTLVVSIPPAKSIELRKAARKCLTDSGIVQTALRSKTKHQGSDRLLACANRQALSTKGCS